MCGFLGFVFLFVPLPLCLNMCRYFSVCICVNSWKYLSKIQLFNILQTGSPTPAFLSPKAFLLHGSDRSSQLSENTSSCWKVYVVVKSIIAFENIFEAYYELRRQSGLCNLHLGLSHPLFLLSPSPHTSLVSLPLSTNKNNTLMTLNKKSQNCKSDLLCTFLCTGTVRQRKKKKKVFLTAYCKNKDWCFLGSFTTKTSDGTFMGTTKKI